MNVVRTLLLLAALLLACRSALAGPPPAIEDLAAMRETDPVALLEILDQELVAVDPDANPRHVAHLFRLRAETLRDRGEHDRARDDASEFQQRADALGDPALVSRALVLHGTIDAEQNHIADALDRFHEARRLLEAGGQTRELALVNNAIGVAHNFALDFVRARHYYAEALRLARQVGDEALESSALGNLALAVCEIDGPEAGLPMHREALALAERRGDRHGVALQNALICERLMELGRLDEARTACLQALDQVRALHLTRPQAGLRMTLGDISRREGKPREALGFYEAALEDAEGVVPGVVLTLHQQLSEVHDALGETEPALRHLQALVALREESRDQERQSLIEELEVKYNVEQRERKLEMMTLDARLQEAELRQRTLLLLATAIGLVLACLATLFAWRGYRVKAGLQNELDLRNQKLEQAVERIGALARTDDLTGLWNRRAFEEVAINEMARAERGRQPLTVAMADIDGFKQVNDRFGHEAGDDVIKELSDRLRDSLRRTDSVCRWGGEEFLCLLPDNDTAAAHQAMERVRRHLAEHPVRVGSEALPITMTFGISLVEGDLAAAIRGADSAMYEGKRNGRDQIVVAGSSS